MHSACLKLERKALEALKKNKNNLIHDTGDEFVMSIR